MRRTFSWLPWVLLILVIAGFFAWQQYQKPKAPVASDGIKMPAEKVEPLINTTRTGGVVSYSAAVKVAALKRSVDAPALRHRRALAASSSPPRGS